MADLHFEHHFSSGLRCSVEITRGRDRHDGRDDLTVIAMEGRETCREARAERKESG